MKLQPTLLTDRKRVSPTPKPNPLANTEKNKNPNHSWHFWSRENTMKENQEQLREAVLNSRWNVFPVLGRSPYPEHQKNSTATRVSASSRAPRHAHRPRGQEPIELKTVVHKIPVKNCNHMWANLLFLKTNGIIWVQVQEMEIGKTKRPPQILHLHSNLNNRKNPESILLY